MRLHPPFTLALVATTACIAAFGTSSCRKTLTADRPEPPPEPPLAPEFGSNQLASLPGALYQSQATSSIHWQQWSKATLDRARAANRLVLCMIVLPQQPSFRRVIRAMEEDAAVMSAIEKNYVPVLVDADAAREMGILAADLCSEIQQGLQLPLLVWMTDRGHPVAWDSLAGSPSAIGDQFERCHAMVAQMVEDDQKEGKDRGYIFKNSALDHEGRKARVEERRSAMSHSEEPATDTVRALRQLVSLYDVHTRSFDQIGGLFPSGVIELLAAGALQPTVPAQVRSRCKETTIELLSDLLASPMFDPLDGGLFTSRRGVSWALPAFHRETPGQARAVVALLQAYQVDRNPEVLERALGVIAHLEETCMTPDGLFAVGLTEESPPKAWMWRVEQVEEALGPEDAVWWTKATGMRSLGNIPSEADPERELFRCNTVGLVASKSKIAQELGWSEAEFAKRFNEARVKLLNERRARIRSVKDETPHFTSSFRMVSAYAAAFVATGDVAYRTKAVSLLKKARKAFSDEQRLRAFATAAPDPVGAGRAFHYGLAVQAAVDVAQVTSDEKWLLWAEDLATTATEVFSATDYFKECPDEAKLIDLPYSDSRMLFDDSSVGLFASAEYRLRALKRPLVASLRDYVTPLPAAVVDQPVFHTDLLLAAMGRFFESSVVVGKAVPDDLRKAVERLPLRLVPRRAAMPDDDVPEDAVKVLLPGGGARLVTSVRGLQDAFLPSP